MSSRDEVVSRVAAEMNDGRHLVADHLWDGICRHVLDGGPTGHFLAALFDNDLRETIGRADDMVLFRVRDLIVFMHNFTPGGCWGSPAKAQSWRDRGGIRGGAHLVREGGS